MIQYSLALFLCFVLVFVARYSRYKCPIFGHRPSKVLDSVTPAYRIMYYYHSMRGFQGLNFIQALEICYLRGRIQVTS